MKISALCFVLSILAFPALVDVVPEGTGLMYDSNYSFFLTAPKGWVLDSSAVKNKGVCAVFYPKGSSWADGKVVFYVNTRAKTDKVKTAEDVVKADIDDLHKNGSPHSAASKVKEIKLKDSRVATIWQYTGDAWGNYEETALVTEEKGFSAMVLTARTKEAMAGALPAFDALVASYQYVGHVKIEK